MNANTRNAPNRNQPAPPPHTLTPHEDPNFFKANAAAVTAVARAAAQAAVFNLPISYCHGVVALSAKLSLVSVYRMWVHLLKKRGIGGSVDVINCHIHQLMGWLLLHTGR